MIAAAHKWNVPVLLDGAQAAPHIAVDVQALDCDFYVFSGHKMCGPTGIGVLYGKTALLEKMQPYQGGGDMILSVTFEHTTYNTIPYKFEAGTPAIAAAIGAINGVRIIGAAQHKAAVLSFEVDGIHPHDVGTILDQDGIAIRAGHHCAQPVMQRFGVPATARASFAFYNTLAEVDALVAGVRNVQRMFA